MSVRIRIPAALRQATDGLEVVQVSAATIKVALQELITRYPVLKERLVDDFGTVRRFVNVYVNGEDIRFLQQGETALCEGDEVSIIPAIAGG